MKCEAVLGCSGIEKAANAGLEIVTKESGIYSGANGITEVLSGEGEWSDLHYRGSFFCAKYTRVG